MNTQTKTGIVAVGAAVLAAGLALGAHASTAFAGSADRATPEATQAGAEVDPSARAVVSPRDENGMTSKEVAQYWTPQRMRQATTIEAPVAQPDRDRSKAPADVLEPQSMPAVAPAGARAAPGLDAKADHVTKSQLYGNAGRPPAVVTGRLGFDQPNGKHGQCTASVISTENKNTIWTAGHCVHTGGEDGDWNTNFVFAPDADNGQEPEGVWTCGEADSGCGAIAPRGWVDDKSNDYDLGAVVLKSQLQPGGNLQDRVGAFGYKFGYGEKFSDVLMLGYPGTTYPAREHEDLDAEHLWYCLNDTDNESGWWADRIQTECDMRKGASGGPWVDEMNPRTGKGGKIIGTHSGSIALGDWESREIYSASHGDAAIEVINTANEK